MKNKRHVFGAIISWLGVVFLSICCEITQAAPLQLTVEPKGTNQVELTLAPVVPDGYYEVLVRTNGPRGHWIQFAGLLSNSNTTITATCDLGHVEGLKLGTLKNWRFVAGRWDDPLGDELPPLYKELVLRIDPFASGDPYGNPMGDGWNNLQKLQNDMDPMACYAPPAPRFSAAFHDVGTNGRYGNAVLTWEPSGGPVPDYFLVERANRTPKPRTNDVGFMRSGPYGPYGNYPPMRSTNRPPNWPTNLPFRGLANPPPGWPTNRLQNLPGNRPPSFFPGYGRQGFGPETVETGSFVEIARVPGRTGLTEYHYVDTNVDTLLQPLYRIAPHNVPPPHAYLNQIDAAGIRGTIISVTAQQTTNGFALTVPHPIPYARYLLLVRDKNDPQWRASGYFESGTNRDSVYLLVDNKGMMSDGQAPIAMPPVNFLQDVVEPEFTAGWGEDSDGDGLPDIYEVLVTHTDPDNADTGNTGILDGFKEMTGDGWNNLEKFRRRVNPLLPANPPPAMELMRPTGAEIMQAMTPKTDLHCEIQIAVRTNGADVFQPIERVPLMLSEVLNYRQPDERRDFDVRVSWQFAEPKPEQSRGLHFPGEPSWYGAVEPLIGRINLELMTSFKAQLETNPPVAWNDASNMTAATVRAYRAGEMDQGLAMAEMMILAENVAQDFYGKVMDQHGKPVVGAIVTATVTRESSGGGPAKTQTDAHGLFQFTGLRGRSMNIALEKQGFQIEGHGLGLRNVNGPETSPTNRAIYTMWKLKGPEPMIHDGQNYRFKPDNRVYTIDLVSKRMVESTNEAGDLYVQFQRPEQIKGREHYEWSFAMTAINGGFIRVTNDDYLNLAPANGYQPDFSIKIIPSDPQWRDYDEETFYIKSRKGHVYGHIHLKIYPESRSGSSLEIESYINPSGSRNLEFNHTNQYTPEPETMVPTPVISAPKTSRLISTNRSGQIVSWGSMVLPYVKSGTRFISIAAGGEHSLGVTSDGSVIAWGRNLSGESTVPDGLSNVIAVAAGGRSNKGFSVALRGDGRVFAWGDNDIFQTTVPAGLSNVVAISAGTDHCLALKNDGTVVGWGFNEDGKTQSPPGLSNVVAIAAGAEHSVALRSDGTVIAWGRNQWGQTNVPSGLSNVVSICSGSYFGLALRKDGKVVGWGGTFNKETDLPKDLTNVTAIAAGPWDAMALKRDGTVVVWGRDIFSPTQVPAGLSNVVLLAGGGSDHGGHCLAIKSDGTIVGWGNNNYGQSLAPGGMTDIVSIAAGVDHYLAIRADGSLIGWGGQEHQGNGQAWVPAALGPVLFAAGGQDHSVVVRSDGTLLAWGYDSYGQSAPPGNLTSISAVASGTTHSLALRANGTVIGWGASPFSSVPASLSNVVSIAVGSHHSLALERDGTVVAWGTNGVVMKTVLEDISDIVTIAAGSGDHDLALKRDGTVIAWGSNSAGQTNVPTGLTNIVAIAAGANHSLALRKDGTVVAWGANNAGQTTIPPGLSNVVAIAAGGLSSIAIVVQPPGSYTQHISQLRHELIALIAAFVFCLVGLFWLLARRAGSRAQPDSSDQ
jgi:alpha-tubulin suppressor-like RCC1 family protein